MHKTGPSRKRDRFKEWLSGFFSPNDEIGPMSDGPQSHAESSEFFKNAQGFAVHLSPMTSIQGDNNSTLIHVQMDHTMTQIMSLLSQHIIHGAALDDSAREPPPRCHPETRVKLIARIATWFDGQAQPELLLWITGPAGVGKSAIVQTFAEHLVKSKSLGASVFISRPNKRNKPQGIFLTVAYQLATRIEAYRKFIAERLGLDPSLLEKGMAAQFATLIVEPFIEQKIGAGGKRGGILLDGLDELEGEDAQSSIIQLVSTFVYEHPDTPLVWIIASRPESHISNTFDDDDVRRSYWSEYIPIDSTEACGDVERFLRSNFNTTQKKYRHSVPSNWPSSEQFLKLAAAASGLFIYAEVVMRFIRDSDYADPVSRLEALLSVIDRSGAVPTQENPFVHLDALYKEILSSIPPMQWPTAKRLLAFTIYGEQIPIPLQRDRQNIQTLRGMSILFGITRYVVYGCLNKCRSTLKIPDWGVAHKEKLTLLHASFADYLTDSSRSGDFHVGNAEDVGEDVVLRLLEIWNKCSGDDIPAASVESSWRRYCSEWDDRAPSKDIVNFHGNLLHEVVGWLGFVVYHVLSKPVNSPTYAQLCKVHMIKLCYCFNADNLVDFVHDLIRVSPVSNHMGLFREFQLRDLKFEHLDWKEMSPARVRLGKLGEFPKAVTWILKRPRSSAELAAFVAELESLQECSPELKVVVYGGIRKGRVAVFRYSCEQGVISYTIPCCDVWP